MKYEMFIRSTLNVLMKGNTKYLFFEVQLRITSKDMKNIDFLLLTSLHYFSFQY